LDRFFRGLVSGLVGGIAMNLWSLVSRFVLKWELLSFIEWAGVALFGDLPRSHLQGAFALLMQLLWTGLLGVLFAFLVPVVTSRGYLIKGAFFGVITGFALYAVPILFQAPFLTKHSFATVFSNHMGGLLWGLATAQSLQWLDRRVRT